MSEPKKKYWLGFVLKHDCGQEMDIIRIFVDSNHTMSVEGICPHCAEDFYVEINLLKMHAKCAEMEKKLNEEQHNIIDFPTDKKDIN